MKTVPRMSGWSGQFDFSRVNTAAEALVEQLVQSLVTGCGTGGGTTTVSSRNTNGE